MGELIQFDTASGTAPGWLATPPGGSGLPLVLIQEWWGLVDHIRELAERLATEGFVVLAPDLYRGESTTEPDEAGKKLMSLQLSQAADDIAGAARALLARDDVTSQRVGVAGFCMGGGLAILAATTSDDIRAAVSFYPVTPWDDFAPQWTRAAGKAVQLHCSEEDGTSSAPGIAETVVALRAAGAEVEVHDYRDSRHAFVNDHRPDVHDPEHARAALARTVAFLRAHLG